MKIDSFVAGELETNCHLVSDQKTGEALIIDPGDEANFISEKILQSGLKPVAIVATHGHFDHILAGYELQIAFKLPFLIHRADEKIVGYMNQSAQWWLGRKIIEKPPKINQFIEEGDLIHFGKSFLEVFQSPGHSPGGVCLFNQNEKILFSGDTLFKDGIGRTDFRYSSASDLEKSLKKIRQKFPGFLVYPGHGSSFYL